MLSWIPLVHMPSLAILAMITSQVEAEKIRGDVEISNFQECGLLHPSKVRLAKMVTIEEKLLLKKIGKLDKKYWTQIQKEFARLFSF